MSGLDGQVVLVTGASRGIGLGIACGLAKAGAQVVMNYRSDAQRAEEALEQVRALNPTATLFQADIAVPQGRRRHVPPRPADLRPARRPGAERRHHRRRVRADDGRREVATSDRHEPLRRVRLPAGGESDDDPAALGRDRGRRIDECGERAGRTGELRRLEGRAAGHRPGAGQRARTEQHPGQRGRPRLRGDGHDSGHAGRPARRISGAHSAAPHRPTRRGCRCCAVSALSRSRAISPGPPW